MKSNTKNNNSVTKPISLEPKKGETLLEHLQSQGFKICPKCPKTGDVLWPN